MVTSSWARGLAGVLLLGAASWVVAGLVIVWQPPGASLPGVYATLVPASVALLVVGSWGIDAWLRGPRRKRSRRGGLASGLRAMSSDRYTALSSVEGHHDAPGLSVRRAGVLTMRAGGAAVLLSSLVLQGEVGPLRTLLFTGWFLFFAGALALAAAVLASGEAPRPAGVLLATGSLLAFSPLVTILFGNTRRAGMLGPLLPAEGGGFVPSLVPWLAFGAGCAWLGLALWQAASRQA